MIYCLNQILRPLHSIICRLESCRISMVRMIHRGLTCVEHCLPDGLAVAVELLQHSVHIAVEFAVLPLLHKGRAEECIVLVSTS